MPPRERGQVATGDPFRTKSCDLQRRRMNGPRFKNPHRLCCDGRCQIGKQNERKNSKAVRSSKLKVGRLFPPKSGSRRRDGKCLRRFKAHIGVAATSVIVVPIADIRRGGGSSDSGNARTRPAGAGLVLVLMERVALRLGAQFSPS